jgi:phospholipase C
MWQQLDCSVERSSFDNPSGCDGKLFAWVENTIGAGDNGLSHTLYAQDFFSKSFDEFFVYPSGFSATDPPTAAQWIVKDFALYDSVPATTGEGSTALGFYNVQQGDVPYLKSLADTYAMSDNFHQSVNVAPAPITSCGVTPI